MAIHDLMTWSSCMPRISLRCTDLPPVPAARQLGVATDFSPLWVLLGERQIRAPIQPHHDKAITWRAMTVAGPTCGTSRRS